MIQISEINNSQKECLRVICTHFSPLIQNNNKTHFQLSVKKLMNLSPSEIPRQNGEIVEGKSEE